MARDDSLQARRGEMMLTRNAGGGGGILISSSTRPAARPPPKKGYLPRSNQGAAGFPDGRDPRRGMRDDLPPARGAEGAGEAACGNFLGEGDPREYLGNVVKSQGRAFITTWPGS